MLLRIFIFFLDLSANFSEKLVKALPGANFIDRSDAALRDAIRGLVDNFIISESKDEDKVLFNPQEFVQALVSALVDSFASVLADSDQTTEACIQRVAVSLVNAEASNASANQIQVIRQGLSTLIRIGEFLEEQKEELSRATILDECISALINLTFCSRCTQKTPPLCFNTCNALLQACYSPYYTTFNEQYKQLWRVARQVVTITNTTVKNVIVDAATLIDIDTIVSIVVFSVNHECASTCHCKK